MNNLPATSCILILVFCPGGLPASTSAMVPGLGVAIVQGMGQAPDLLLCGPGARSHPARHLVVITSAAATSPLGAASPACSQVFTSHTAEPVEGTHCSCKNFYSSFILNSSYLTPLFINSCVNNFTPASSAAASWAPMVNAQLLTCPSGHVPGLKPPSGHSCSAALPQSHRGHHVKGPRPPGSGTAELLGQLHVLHAARGHSAAS